MPDRFAPIPLLVPGTQPPYALAFKGTLRRMNISSMIRIDAQYSPPGHIVNSTDSTGKKTQMRCRTACFPFIPYPDNCPSSDICLHTSQRCRFINSFSANENLLYKPFTYGSYWRCPHTMRSRVYETVRCLSVCLCRHEPTAANPPLQVCCRGPGEQMISIDCCSSGMWRANAGSAKLLAYVGS